MGCDEYPLFQDRYELGDTVAELWNSALAKRFPNISHRMCFQQMHVEDGQQYPVPFDPPRCQDWHCPRCGRACNMYGHHDCGAAS